MQAYKVCLTCMTKPVSVKNLDDSAFQRGSRAPALLVDCPICSRYSIDAIYTHGNVLSVHPATAKTLAPLVDTERGFLAECIRRMADDNHRFHLSDTTVKQLLADRRWGQALAEQWGFGSTTLMLSGGGLDVHNRLFYVLHKDGSRHILRLLALDKHPNEALTLIDWLQRLRDAGISTLSPVAGLDGHLLQETQLGSQTRCALVFNWIDGEVWNRLPQDRITVDLLRNFGRAVARMHQVSTSMEIPDWYACHRYDGQWVAQYLATLKSTEHGDRTAQKMAVFTDYGSRLLQAMSTLGQAQSDFGLVAADLAAHNTIVVGETPHLVDMMSFGRGYYLAEMPHAIHLSAQKEGQEELLRGYRDICPLPRGFDEFYGIFAEARQIGFHWFDRG